VAWLSQESGGVGGGDVAGCACFLAGEGCGEVGGLGPTPWMSRSQTLRLLGRFRPCRVQVFTSRRGHPARRWGHPLPLGTPSRCPVALPSLTTGGRSDLTLHAHQPHKNLHEHPHRKGGPSGA
jgi:hypothetical protein